jgi:succinate dehydrogenase/fumarate reductase cytochrome b subunit
MKTSWLQKLSAYSLLAMIMVLACTNVSAATKFYDDFEDGDHNGWLVTSNGSGSTGVEEHNGSLMAFVYHTGNGFHMLSRDFSYVGSDSLAFDMHAVAYMNYKSHAMAGVKLSFLNDFNVVLGTTTIAYSTNASWLGVNDLLVDNAQHHYGASFSDFAALAGLGATDPISKLSISFFAQAQTSYYYGSVKNSSAKVWFDNVTISNSSPVPVPAAVWLFGSGLLGFFGISKRNRG